MMFHLHCLYTVHFPITDCCGWVRNARHPLQRLIFIDWNYYFPLSNTLNVLLIDSNRRPRRPRGPWNEQHGDIKIPFTETHAIHSYIHLLTFETDRLCSSHQDDGNYQPRYSGWYTTIEWLTRTVPQRKHSEQFPSESMMRHAVVG